MITTTFFLFLGASIALTVAPGPDNLFVVTQGISRGRKAAVITAWGMCSGITVHTLAAAAGISALFYASATLFTLVKYAGAAYLLYLAFMAVKESKTPLEKKSGNGPGAFALFKRGFIMNVLNPKVALFFLAFLPQFTVKEAGSIALQMVALGLIFMVQAMIIFTLIGFFSGSVGEYVIARPKISRYFNWLAAGIFASLGIKLAFTQR